MHSSNPATTPAHLWEAAETARRRGDADEARLLYVSLVSAVLDRQLVLVDQQNWDGLTEIEDELRLARASHNAIEALDCNVVAWLECGEPPLTAATPNNVEVYGFWHIATVNDWREIVQKQLAELHRGGLYERASRIFVTVLGTEEFSLNDPKIEVVHRSPDLSACEFPTLSYLHKFCQSKDCLVFYLHTKGVFSGRQFPTVADWRRLLEHFVLGKYERCIRLLRDGGYDAVGVNWHQQPWPHFSGNFWWATSHYVQTLPEVEQLSRDGSRRNGERWIGLNADAHVACLHQSLVNHYETDYSSTLYERATDGPLPVVRSAPWECLSAWRGLENLIQPHLRRVDPISLVVEVGIEFGYSLFSLAAALPSAKIIGVDPYDSLTPFEQERLARLHWQGVSGNSEAEAWLRRYLPMFPNVQLWKMTSQMAAEQVAHPVDILHLDAVHTYEDVARDFAFWEPKVRPGGCVMFHDTQSYPNDVGRFFRELPGKKTEIPEHYGLGFWFKPVPHRPWHIPRRTNPRVAAAGRDQFLLSVLIPTLPSRETTFTRLVRALQQQIERGDLADKVEVLSFLDDREHSVGAKRNALMHRACGEFVVFIDDDDEVDDEYLSTVCGVIEAHPDIDCIGYVGELAWVGGQAEPTIYSLKYRQPKDCGAAEGCRVYLRPPQHVNPMRRSIAVRFPFPDVSCGEDLVRSTELARQGALRKEYFFGRRVMYRYCFDPRNTETQRPSPALVSA